MTSQHRRDVTDSAAADISSAAGRKLFIDVRRTTSPNGNKTLRGQLSYNTSSVLAVPTDRSIDRSIPFCRPSTDCSYSTVPRNWILFARRQSTDVHPTHFTLIPTLPAVYAHIVMGDLRYKTRSPAIARIVNRTGCQ